MWRRFLEFGLILGLIFGAGVAVADEAAQILKKVDANLTKVQDQTYRAKISVFKGDKLTKEMEFTAKLKGLKMKLVRLADCV